MPTYRVTFADGYQVQFEADGYALAIEQAQEIDGNEGRALKGIESVDESEETRSEK